MLDIRMNSDNCTETKNAYFLMKDSKVLEVIRTQYPINPFISTKEPNLVFGRDFEHAFKKLEKELPTETIEALRDRLKAVVKSYLNDLDYEEEDENCRTWLETIDCDAMDLQTMIETLDEICAIYQDILPIRKHNHFVYPEGCALIYLTNDIMKANYGPSANLLDLYEHKVKEMLDAAEKLLVQYELNDVFDFSLYNLDATVNYSDCDFFGDNIAENGLLLAAGYNLEDIKEFLGSYRDIEDCYCNNAKKIGVYVEPVKPLHERVTVID